MRYAVAAAFVATVYAANWLLSTFGVVPIGFGLMAPAGIFAAGAGFLLRDALHECAGRSWVVAAIIAGAVLSYLLGADATIPGGHLSIAASSGAAFLLSEAADYAAYAPLRARSLIAGVGFSQVVAAAADSALFLWLAFGSLSLFAGQFLGKAALALPVLAALVVYRTRERLALNV